MGLALCLKDSSLLHSCREIGSSCCQFKDSPKKPPAESGLERNDLLIFQLLLFVELEFADLHLKSQTSNLVLVSER